MFQMTSVRDSKELIMRRVFDLFITYLVETFLNNEHYTSVRHTLISSIRNTISQQSWLGMGIKLIAAPSQTHMDKNQLLNNGL